MNEMELTGRKVSVIGAERSGIAASELLIKVGADVFLSDKKPRNEANPYIKEIEKIGVKTEFGGHSQKIYDAHFMVVSPGVPQDAEIIITAKKRNILVISEVELASWFIRRPIVAITGSNGKTTTSTIFADMCKQSGYSTFLAGNIGIPFSHVVLKNFTHEPANAIYVLEISSFQMEHILHFKPQIVVLLNLTADHLDRYASMEEYASAKMKIMDNLTQDDFVVYNKDDPVLSQWIDTRARKIPFTLGKDSMAYFSVNETKVYNEKEEVLIEIKDISLLGKHNLLNFLAAATAGRILKISQKDIRSIMETFRGVPHRLEHVLQLEGVDFYNDSKATNIESVIVALESFTRPVILILGGRDKGADFTKLLPYARQKVKDTIIIGEATEKIQFALANELNCTSADSLEKAVQSARQLSEPGDVVLLSPGCASFDMFSNFEERGNVFKQVVQQLEGNQ